MDSNQYDQLVGAIYDAALEPSLWEPLMTRISNLIGATASQYMVTDAQLGGVAFSAISQHRHEAEIEYARYYYSIDPNIRCLLSVPAGQWTCNHHFYDDQYVKYSEYYQDFLIPNGTRYLTGNMLVASHHLQSILAFHRNEAKEPFGPQELGFLNQITGHLQRSSQLMHKTMHLQRQACMSADALHQLALPLVICDALGSVRFANPAAEAILRQGDGLLMAKGDLRAFSEKGALAKLLEEACSRSHGGTLAVYRPHRRPLHLLVTPLAPHIQALNPWQQPLAMVLISDPEHQPDLPADTLATLFRFTPAESRLGLALAHGAELAEYAETHGLSMSTVRSQLRALLAKTGTRRQAELVRMLGSLPTLHAPR